MDKYILDKDGNPVVENDLYKWAAWFEKANSQRQVAYTRVGKVKVSTVFLGLDNSFGQGPPLLFETMVFGGHMDDFIERYSTRAEALKGHADVVEQVRETVTSVD